MSGTTQLLRLPAVIAAVGLKKSMIYNLIRKGKFARPVVLNSRAVVQQTVYLLETVQCFSLAAATARRAGLDAQQANRGTRRGQFRTVDTDGLIDKKASYMVESTLSRRSFAWLVVTDAL